MIQRNGAMVAEGQVKFKMAALKTVRVRRVPGSEISMTFADFLLNNTKDGVHLVLRPMDADRKKVLCAAFFNLDWELICALDLSGERDSIGIYIHPRLLNGFPERLSDDSAELRSFALRFWEYYQHVVAVADLGPITKILELGLIDRFVDERGLPTLSDSQIQKLKNGSIVHVRERNMQPTSIQFLINALEFKR